MPCTIVAAYSCQVSSWNRPTLMNAAPVVSRPMVITVRAPTQRIRVAVVKPITKLAAADGSISRPDSVIVASKP